MAKLTPPWEQGTNWYYVASLNEEVVDGPALGKLSFGLSSSNGPNAMPLADLDDGSVLYLVCMNNEFSLWIDPTYRP